MKERLTKLLAVKSIVTIVLTAAFTFLAVTEKIGATEFLTIFTTVIAFYFGTQTKKEA